VARVNIVASFLVGLIRGGPHTVMLPMSTPWI